MNNVPKLPGVDYVAKNWALAMMLKALPLVHFWSVLLLKEQMMTSVRKTLKTLVWSAQNRSISSEICPENNHKNPPFFLGIAFRPSLPRKFLRNRPIFSAILSLRIPRNLTFFSATYQKPCLENFQIRQTIFVRFSNMATNQATVNPPVPVTILKLRV